ncbi:MAG: methyltransferase family protein [Promethearchaeota archaeon]
MIEWINLTVLLVSIFVTSYLYNLSIQPVKRSETRGEKAWKECATFRALCSISMVASVVTSILWIWFPIPLLDYKIDSNYTGAMIAGIIILVICVPIMAKGEMDAGSETMKPSKDTKMYGGIYNHIRHPQTLGEWPTFIGMGFFINSWFIVILFLVWVIIYTPIMISLEEKDLVRRFGDAYREYQKRTGALFPKFWKKKVPRAEGTNEEP